MNLIKFCMLVVNETNPLTNTNATFDAVWADVDVACENLTDGYEDMKANASDPAYKVSTLYTFSLKITHETNS